jgi:hypothetical protein
MAIRQPRTGLLIMRVERQDEYLLITLTFERSLLDQPIGAPAGQRLQLSDSAAAIQVIQDFLDSF